MTILTADQLNTIAKQTGYTPTGGGFSSVGLPTTLNSTNTQSTPAIPIVSPTADNTNYQGIIKGAVSYTTPNGSTVDANGNVTSPPPTTAASDAPAPTPVADKIKAMYEKISSYIGQDTGKEQFSQNQQDIQAQNLGYKDYNDLLSAQTNLSKQAQALNFEAQGIPFQIQDQSVGRGRTEGGIAPLEADAQRSNAIKALGIQAKYALLSGDVQTAKDAAQRAVDYKYKTIEENIDAYSKQLQLMSPSLTEEEKKIAEQKQIKNEAKKTELADKKAKQTALINDANNAKDYNTAAAALALDPNSSTFTRDLANLQSKIVNNTAPKIIGSATTGYFQYDPTTGQTTPISNPTPTTPSAPKGSIISGTLTYTPQDQAEDSQQLNSSRGQDGYVDPTLYQNLYKLWIQHGGQLEDFLKTYPPKNYINPANTWLPSYLMPSTKTTSTREI